MEKVKPIHHILIVIALCALATGLYARTLRYGFVWDDEATILKDPRALYLKWSARAFYQPIDRLYRPLRTVVYAVDAKFSKGGRFLLPYHASNIVFYAIAVAAFYLFLFALTRRIDFAAAGAALYAVHPIHVETVAFISGGTADLLAAPALFGSFILFISAVRDAKRFNTYLLSGLILYFAALLSKESVAVGFAVLIVCFILFPRSDAEGYSRRAAIVSVIVFIASLIYFFIRSWYVPAGGQAITPRGDTLTARVAVVAPALLDYFRLAVFPLRQCAMYELRDPVLPYWHALAPIAAVMAALALAAVLIRKKAPVVSFAAFWWIFMLAPVTNVFALTQLKAERFLFLPSAAFCMIAACVFLVRRRNLKVPLIAAFVMIFVLYFMLSWKRMPVFMSDHDLWSSTVVCAEDSPLAQYNFGNDCMRRSDFKCATAAYMKTIKLKPDYYLAYERLADSYAWTGDYEKAVKYLKKSLEILPADSKTMIKIGFANAKMGRHDEAVLWYGRAYSIDSDPRLLKMINNEKSKSASIN